MEEDEDEKSQKIQMIAFTTNEKSHSPNDIMTNYLNNNSHFIIKKNKQLIAFSTVLPDQKKPTKIMLCTLVDLNIEYEGITNVNCYLVIIDLQKETSKEKLNEIFTYINQYCDLSKKIFLLGVKSDEEENGIKISEDEIDQKVNGLNLDYEYYELNLDNNLEVSDKIVDIFKYCYKISIKDIGGKNNNDAHSCAIY